MVGDNLETDIRGGLNAGVLATILVPHLYYPPPPEGSSPPKIYDKNVTKNAISDGNLSRASNGLKTASQNEDVTQKPVPDYYLSSVMELEKILL